MKRDPETQTALEARHDAKAPQRFDAEPSQPSCFADLSGADGDAVPRPVRVTEYIGGREVTVERVGILPSDSGCDWCACFRQNDIGDPQGYGDTREEALADLAEAWADQVGDSAQTDPVEPREFAWNEQRKGCY